MTQHDKHQYYFEKYLRNEMPEDERLALDEKLRTDASLRMAFEYYKLNRQQLLDQLIEEHKLARRDNRFNKLIFLFISLTGIGLTFNYFLYKDDASKNVNTSKNIIVRYIPFLDWKAKSEKNETSTKKVRTEPSAYAISVGVKEEDPIEELEPSLDANERLLSDRFVSDSFITILEKTQFEMLMFRTKTTDSLKVDSLPAKKPFTPASNAKAKKLLVEFWQSPVNYKGYLYTDNKLVLYGILHPSNVYIYKEAEANILVLPVGEFPLIEQPKFTRF